MGIECSLNGQWKIQPDSEKQGTALGYFKPDYNDSEWRSVDIPCHWELAIPEYYRKNVEVVWARKKFTLAELGDLEDLQSKFVRLVFKGVFYYADVYFNSTLVKTHEGYFEPFSIEISKILQEENLIAVRVECRNEHNLFDKQQIMGTFGHWDASNPHANPGGIWNDVSIIISNQLAIEQVRQITHLESLEIAKEHIFIGINSSLEQKVNLRINYTPKNFDGESFSQEWSRNVKIGINQLDFEMTLDHLALWWTHDYGLQNLYIVKVECIAETDSTILDEYALQTGIKEFRLDRSGQYGTHWKVYLNKHLIFPKGTNYPPSQRLQTATKEKFQQDLQLFKDANMNILRIHAHISRPEFYEACDEMGFLLWQDMPLQWIYNNKKFPQIELQIQTAVKLLQSHPCIGIWCAHNEPFCVPNPGITLKSAIFFILGLSAIVISSLFKGILGFGISLGLFLIAIWVVGKFWDLYPLGLFTNSNSAILDPALYRRIVKEDEGQNAVVPYSGINELPFTVFRSPRLPAKEFGGFRKFYTDFHYYNGWYNSDWKQEDYRHFMKIWGLKGKLRDTVRFVTEYGAQAFPTVENLLQFHERPAQWPPEAAWWTPLMQDHRFQKNVQDKWIKADKYASIEDYVEDSQKWQAEVIKAATEMFRQEKYFPVAGLISFLGIDCFPAITWAIIDYYRTPKQAYYIVKDAFEPLYAMVDWPKRVYSEGERYSSPIYLTNDYWEPLDAISISWKVTDPAQNIIAQSNIDTKIEADCVAEIGHLEFTVPKEPFVLLELSWENPKKPNKLFTNQYRFDIGISYWAKNY